MNGPEHYGKHWGKCPWKMRWYHHHFDRRQVRRLDGHYLEPWVRKNRQGLMTLIEKGHDQEQCHSVLESHYAFALIGWIFLMGQDSSLTYLLFPEDLVSLDTPWGLLVQGPLFLLDVPLAQASLYHLRMTGRFCRHPDGTWVTLTWKVIYVLIMWDTWTRNTVLLLFLPRPPNAREKNTLKLRRKKIHFWAIKVANYDFYSHFIPNRQEEEPLQCCPVCVKFTLSLKENKKASILNGR